MECVSADFGKDMSLKSNTQVCFDDFLVDEFLDFSNEDAFLEENPELEIEEEEEEENKDFSSSNSVSSEKNENSNQSSDSSTKDDFWSVSSRDFEDLEWLSHFVSDPLHEYSPPLPGPVYVSPETQPEPEMGISPIPSKPRTKRQRIINRFWSVGSHFFSNTSSSSITSSSSCSSPSSPLVLSHALPAKKPRKKPAVEGVTGVQSVRRCSHCGVQKTPQWRAGPMGSKTLCNACGVRFKSGRLFPEYRPACSPTFSNELHSNHHRKVLEMRRKKEGSGGA